ncbi:MAG: aminotransferase class V-fold PLP-dependent enzyme, partial [Gammaproteobacteria bacterium]|nr:aminotransferase class V-fold PLP-dependent enzyme [Gammaproteobacteria bacterium]
IDMLWKELSEIDEVNLYGPAPDDVPRTGTMTFNIKGFDHGLSAAALNDYHNIQVRNGCFCAHPYVREMLKRELWDMDLDPNALNAEADIERKRGMVRASLGLYTSEEDLRALIDAIKDLIARKDEIHSDYVPEGSNGYRHRRYAPEKSAIFDPMVALEKALQG